MARKKKDPMAAAVEAAFNKVGNRRQFPMMDLPKIHAAGMDAARAGLDVEAAVAAACDRYEHKA